MKDDNPYDQTPQGRVDAVVAKRQDRIGALRETLDRCTTELQRALPKGAMAEQYTRILMTTLQKTPKLAQCTQRSIVVAAFEAAALGLTIDGVLGHAYLVPYKNLAQLQIGYRGFVRLAHNSRVGLTGGCACAKDTFEFEEGTTPFVRHVRLLSGDRGPPVAAYGIARPYEHPNMEIVRVLTEGDVAKRRAMSQSAGRDDSPWNQWPEEMWSKTGIRAIAKHVPQSSDLQRVAVADEQRELGIGSPRLIDVDIPQLGDE